MTHSVVWMGNAPTGSCVCTLSLMVVLLPVAGHLLFLPAAMMDS